MIYSRAAQALLYRLLFPRRHQCVLCGRRISSFLPYRRGSYYSPPLMRALGVIGSHLDLFECPWCGCHDRERHLYLYFNADGILRNLSGKSVIHFAPEKRLAIKILNSAAERYIKCDLYPREPDVTRVDMLNIPFRECSFDLLIANHVLEHVTDDWQALAEIYRVLKPEGFAVLQTPYSSKLHRTWSDPGIDEEISRLHAYGQEDHVRLYGRDIFERFRSVGFESCVRTHDELLPGYSAKKYGVNDQEPFFLFRRLN